MLTHTSMFYRRLYRDNLFPPGTKIVGYARSSLTIDNIKEKSQQYLKVSARLHTTRVVYHDTPE